MEIDQLKQSKIFKSTIILLALLIFGLLMDFFVMPWFVDLGDEKEMPDVVEKNANEAKNLLEKQGFTVIMADSVFDASFEAGMVVEQMPLAYSTVKTGRNVYLTVSIGERPIIMPNLFGISPRDAELKLNALGLKLKATLGSYSDLYPDGAVISQSFPQGQQIKKNTAITITVSFGEKPENRTIPNLIGKSYSAAKQRLEQLGVSIDKVEYEESTSYLPDTVLKQSLKEGTSITEDTKLTLTVSKLESDSQDN
ncbi:MAG: PASTA domain-containing protein [Calditrichaeota bacterium]|nr:MAG: PASTA domain-containing protein [Calditrichota bacterium]MBL1204138.1 PASTA domain-containing protein [Calditrichota bacterium]NOG43969.1 PASTA domain-containing protein [Calditrichota bacterium]